MPEIPLTAADFTPARAPILVACTPAVLGFTSLLPNPTRTWLAVDGSGVVPEPKNATDTREASRGVPRIDPIAPGWRLEMQPAPMALVLISRTTRLVVHLPSALAADVLATPRSTAPGVSFAPDAGTLVITGMHLAWWMPVAPLLALDAATEVRWRIRTVLPTANHAARDEGVVLISAYGRTNIRVGARAVMLGPTPLVKGERVTLVDRLTDANGILKYRELVRADGTSIPLERAPGAEEIAVSPVGGATTAGARPARVPAESQRAFEAMQREGLLGEMTPALYARLARSEGWDPFEPALSVFEALYRYYQRLPRRAAADRFIAHEARFMNETDDVVAELAALVGGEPLFEQVSAAGNSLRVRGRKGVRTLYLDVGFDDVVDLFNGELRARKDPRQFVALHSGDDRRCFLLLADDVAARLRAAGVPLAGRD